MFEEEIAVDNCKNAYSPAIPDFNKSEDNIFKD
jgi:hypothetical protein